MPSETKLWTPANFRLEIDGMPAGVFKNVEGLDSETDVLEAKLPGAVKYGDITLKRGYTSNLDPWGQKVQPGAIDHKINPAAHKINPVAHKIDPISHKISPAMHKLNPAEHKINPAMQKVNPVAHKVSPGAFGHKISPGAVDQKMAAGAAMHKINPGAAAHKVNPAPAAPAQGGGRLVLHGFELDQRNRQLLQHWVDPAAPQKATPRGQIVMLDQSGRPVRRWQFYDAWPSKWSGPSTDSSSSADGGHSVELVVGRLVKM